MASRREGESSSSRESSARDTSRNSRRRDEQTIELPKIVNRKAYQGSAWRTNNPAIRQLSSLFRVRSAPKYYPLGLWHHQKDPEFPDIRNSCLITASQHHGSGSSGKVSETAEKESRARTAETEPLPPLFPNKAPDGVSRQSSDLAEDGKRLSRESSSAFGAQQSQRKSSGSSADEYADAVRSRRSLPPLVRRSPVEIMDDMLPVSQNETETSDGGKSKRDPELYVNGIDTSDDGGKNDALHDDANGILVKDDTPGTASETEYIHVKEDAATNCSANDDRAQGFSAPEPYPPINTIYVCLIIGNAVDAQVKSSLQQHLSANRLQLLDEGYDLDLVTFDVEQVSDLDPHIRQEVLHRYLYQCRGHGLGPFYYALMDTDEEDREPPLTIARDIYEYLLNEAGKRELDGAGLLKDWYEFDESAESPVYRLKSVRDVIPSYGIVSSDALWKRTKRELNRALEIIHSRVVGRSDTEVDDPVLPRSVLSTIIQIVEDVLQTSSDGEFLKSSCRRTTEEMFRIYGNPNDGSSVLDTSHPAVGGTESNDADDALSRSVKDFIEGATESANAINKRRTNNYEKSTIVYYERWPHRRRTTEEIPEEFLEGSETVIDRIREMALDPNDRRPIAVQSEGREMRLDLISFLAKAAMEWISPSPAVIVQHSGLTERSSRFDCFLETLCADVSTTYGYDTHVANTRDSLQCVKFFRTLLHKASAQDGPEQPLVVLLDVDNLSVDCNSWLPKELPSNIYVILTVSNISQITRSETPEAAGINLLAMDAKPDDDSLEQFSNLSNDIDRAESLMGQDFIRDLLRLLTVHENGMTERDLAEALISTKSERIPGRAQLDLLRLWIRCAQTLLSSWMTSAYDSGKLLYRLPKKYHAPVVNRYAGRGGASSPSGEMADYQTAVLETYAKPVLDQQVSSKAPTRDGLSVLFTFRLLAFTRCLSVCTLSAAQKRDLFVDTLYNFSWLSSYVHYLSTGAVVRIIWPLRDREEQIQTLCTILELQSAEETDAAIVASGILACLDKNTTGPELVRLYDTTKDWLLNRGISLIPCRPTVAMPGTKHPSVPGPASVIHVFDDETVLTWGLDHGLQVWDLEGVTCLRQMSRRTHWPVHDVTVNGATRVAYFTEETYLIGWKAEDGARTMELDLLPHVSRTGRKFSPQKDVVPFLSVVDVSDNGRLVAVRINHREMLTNDKGIIVVSTEEDGGKIVGAVGDGLFGRNVTNVAFTNDGTMLTITRKLATMANEPGIVFVKTDPSAGDLFTETRASQGTKDNDISTSDEKTEMRAADHQTTDRSESNDSREDEQKTDPRNDDASSDARLETRPTNSETYSSEKNNNLKQDDGTAEEGHWSDIGQSTDKGAIGVIEESEINEERHDVSDKADTTETPSSDPDVTAVSPEGSGGERRKNDSNDGASSERKEPIRRQEALDAADEEASLRADEVVEAPLDEAGSEPSPIRYDFVGGVMARCPDDDSLCVGYSPNGVAKAVPADGILRPYAELGETGSFKIVSVACLGDGRAISAHSQGPGTSPLMLCLWSPEPSSFYVEHRGLFRFVKPADGDHSVMVAYHNKVAIMDVDSRTCTHVFDFPANEITSAILRNGVLYAGTGSSVVTREVSRYAVSPPYDVVASRSDSVTFEDDEQLEAIHVTTIPVEDLPLAMTSYGPSGVSRLVLLPGGDQMAIDVAGALKLMDVADGSLREIGQEVRMLLVDLFIAGSKANSLIALENDSISTGINVLKWELDSLASPPKVVKSQIVQTKWRLSSKKTWLLSLNKRDNSEYADIYVTNLDDLVNDYNRHYVVKESGKNVNFAVSDSGRYMATWQNKGDTITVWDMATGRRVPYEVETDRTTRQDWDERENAQTERRDSASDAQNGGDADVMEQEKESDEPEVVSDGDSIEHTGAATDTKQNVDEDSVKQDSIRDGSEIGDKRADLEQENETTAQTQENGTGRQGQENETDNEGRENETDSQGQENVNENEGRENETGNQGQENETGSQGQENETDSQGQENETDSQGQENETGSQGQENETRNQEQEKETENQGQVNETDNLEHENTTENVKEEITGDEDDRMLGRQSRKLTDNDDHVILGKIEIPVSARSEAVLIVDDQLVIGSKNGYIYQIDIDRLFGIGDDREALAALLMDNRTVLIKDPARSLSLTADGTTLVIVGIKGYVTLLNMSNPTEQVVFDSCQSKVSNAALSVDHSLLLTSGAEGTITLWDALTGQALCTAPTQATIHWLGFVQRDSSVLAWVEKYKGKRSRLIKFDLNR